MQKSEIVTTVINKQICGEHNVGKISHLEPTSPPRRRLSAQEQAMYGRSGDRNWN